MTKRQTDRFLAGPHIARVATVRKDGSPFVVPVWYEWDGRDCYIVGRESSGWVQNIRNEPRVTILIDTDVFPTSKVIIEGRAEVLGSSIEDWREIGKKMVKKYVGADAGISYLQGSLDQPRVTMRISPEKITTWMDPDRKQLEEKPYLAWHPRYYAPGSKFHTAYLADKKRSGARKRSRRLP
jgi:PPOX class probable F420-dependent enzyme